MADSWYYSRGGQSQGPVPWAQLQQFAATGGLAATDLVWTEGMAAWLPASQVPDLFRAPPPPAYGGPQYPTQPQQYPPQQYPPQQYPPQGAPLGYQGQMPMGMQPSPQSAALSGGEWLLCIFCSFIGCIVGIVYLCQGNPKGGKMIGFSILFGIIGGIIRIGYLSSRHHRGW